MVNDNDEMLPKYHQSYWKASTNFKTFPRLNQNIEVDVAIVGGGITGITTAYLLQHEGYKVALIEADQILHGTTGHTTAKITVQHDLIYDELIQHMGKEKARLYYEANNEALQFIRNIVNEKQIKCDFSNQDAYIFTNSEEYVSKLEKEYNAYQQLGIDSHYVERLPFDLQIKAAIVVKDQAQFHPLKYLYHLTEDYIKQGGLIYEKTVAVDIDEGDQPQVITRDGHQIKANFVIIASHFPFYGIRGLYFARMYAERAYVLGIKAKEGLSSGMYISAESPSRSLRYVENNGEKMTLVIGESHKTGQGSSEMLHYKALQAFGDNLFKINEINYRWSTQDLTTLDKVPYIGPITSSHSNVFVATGYRKWGMTNGTLAALMMKDMIMNKDNKFQDVFSPSRFYLDPSLKEFMLINYDVAKHLIKGKLEIPKKSIEELDNDEGAVVTINGKKAGVYKDSKGKLYIVDTTCTHLGCELHWNDAERTWDCPCHGSRFSYTGEVHEGPAENPLERLNE